VLVAKEGRATLGMVTLGEKEKRGDIGLVAVSPEARGKRIGRLLVAAAERGFSARGYSLAQVVTQCVNKSACRLYEACGYRVEKIESVLHFWL
jgi:dTDP-4-amino-4,6-dideoxy-D-galactose acyltransferase